jgi:SH3 domain
MPNLEIETKASATSDIFGSADLDSAELAPIESEADIDFGLVYALFVFIATLEGQLDVLKGEPLELLDDSNSYWWLVRCLETQQVGYIPAENIETPYERLARLNRSRNIENAMVIDEDVLKKDKLNPNKSIKFDQYHEEIFPEEYVTEAHERLEIEAQAEKAEEAADEGLSSQATIETTLQPKASNAPVPKQGFFKVVCF